MDECCANCKLRYDLQQYDYSNGGCVHTVMDGYICMAFNDEGIAVWMIGEDAKTGMCERFKMKYSKGQMS